MQGQDDKAQAITNLAMLQLSVELAAEARAITEQPQPTEAKQEEQSSQFTPLCRLKTLMESFAELMSMARFKLLQMRAGGGGKSNQELHPDTQRLYAAPLLQVKILPSLSLCCCSLLSSLSLQRKT